MELVHTRVFTRNREVLNDPSVRFVLNQGGSRSSKTYSLCQLLLIYALTNPNLVISVVRKTFPALRSSVMRDFFEVMNSLGLYERKRHNRTEHTYTFHNGTMVEFFSIDEEQKVRGRKRNILWVNEANELWQEDFMQLNLRTTDKLIFDYNPSDLSGYLYDIQGRPNSKLIKSTYKDNPFLSNDQIEELEFLRFTDPDMYRIYALGERAQTSEHVLRHWQVLSKPADLDQCAYGLDFGWQHPTSLIRVWHDGTGRKFHLEQVVQEQHLTIDELIARMENQVDKSLPVLADAARPDAISQIQMAGFNCQGADKAVKKGLEILKTSVLTVEPTSQALIRDLENYKYRKIRGVFTDEVVKLYDDGVDATRYACTYLRDMSGGMQFAAMRW